MNKSPTELNTLREEAEARLYQAPAMESVIRPAEELLHELQAHQIELEMQNDELRRTHATLEESRDRYVDLYYFAPVGYLLLTQEGLIAEINLTAAELLGVDRSKLLSRRFATLVTPKDGDPWCLFFSRIMKHDKRLNIELMLKGGNDTEFPVQLDCLCVNSMLRITLTDVTKIKQAEAALREAEALALISAERMQTEEALNRLQKIASQLPGMVFQFRLRADGSSCLPYVSEGIRDIYRLSPEDVREDASKVFALLHPDDYDGIITSIQQSEQDLSPWCHEYRVKFDDGTVRWLLGNARLQREVDGSTLWHGYITDITERMQLEEKLHDSYAFNVSILDSLPAQIAVLDAQGVIVAVNNTWRQFAQENGLPESSQEMLGVNYLDVCENAFNQPYGDEAKTAQTGISRVLSGEQKIFHLVYPCHSPNQQRWFQMTVSRLQGSHRNGVVVSHENITERKHSEQQDKEHLDQLAHISRLGLMSDMASGIVHEVNQPLTAIINYTHASLNLIKIENPDLLKLTEILYKIQQQALRTGQIIQRMREFTKSHAMHRLSTDVNTLIQEASTLCAAQLKQNNIKLILEFEHNLPSIDVDHIQIEQVIINLVRNSADALQNLSEERQRQIAIHSQLTANHELQIRVKDNGPGLNEDQQRQIMTPFYTTKTDGMGIGLSISRSILEAHQGTLHFNSHLGKGTTFYMTLPLQEKSGDSETADHVFQKFTGGTRSEGMDRIDRQLSGLAVDLEPTSKQLMVELDALLTNDRFISDELLTQLKILLPEDKQTDYEALTQHILDTDYPEARAILNTLVDLSKEKVEVSISAQDQRPTILIVDDMRIKQDMLATVLSPEYRVKVAGSGPKALEIVQQRPYPDLILLDINMPHMNGYEVCRILKKTSLSHDIPVIFVTAASDQESEIHGLQQGAEDYISLPITPTIVLLRVRNLILLKHHEKELKRIAHYDALTGIPNRVLLADRMKQAIAQAKRDQKILGVCYLDLDGFKIVNDTLRHQAGDQVLIEITQRIGNILREADTVARLGGDEFVVLLPDLNHVEECITTLKRLLETIALPVRLQDQSFFLTASIGVSIFPDDNNDPDVLLRHADQAMYIAKQSGKNRYHLYDATPLPVNLKLP